MLHILYTVNAYLQEEIIYTLCNVGCSLQPNIISSQILRYHSITSPRSNTICWHMLLAKYIDPCLYMQESCQCRRPDPRILNTVLLYSWEDGSSSVEDGYTYLRTSQDGFETGTNLARFGVWTPAPCPPTTSW